MVATPCGFDSHYQHQYMRRYPVNGSGPDCKSGVLELSRFDSCSAHHKGRSCFCMFSPALHCSCKIKTYVFSHVVSGVTVARLFVVQVIWVRLPGFHPNIQGRKDNRKSPGLQNHGTSVQVAPPLPTFPRSSIGRAPDC